MESILLRASAQMKFCPFSFDVLGHPTSSKRWEGLRGIALWDVIDVLTTPGGVEGNALASTLHSDSV